METYLKCIVLTYRSQFHLYEFGATILEVKIRVRSSMQPRRAGESTRWLLRLCLWHLTPGICFLVKNMSRLILITYRSYSWNLWLSFQPFPASVNFVKAWNKKPNQTLSKKLVIWKCPPFFAPGWAPTVRGWHPGFFALTSLFFLFPQLHLLLPASASFPIKAKGWDLDIFLAVSDILALLHNDLSITKPCLDTFIRRDVRHPLLLAYHILLLQPLILSSKALIWVLPHSEPVLLCHLWLQLFCPSHLICAVSSALLWEWSFQRHKKEML